jgi:rhamnogalacturonan endolyase
MHPPIVIPEKGLPFVRLVKHIDISRYGSEIMKAADIDGDGRFEFVFYQGPGMLAASTFQPGASGPYGKHTTAADQALNCMTAIDFDGNVRWQTGEPWKQKFPFRTHGGHDMLLSADVNGDRRAELIGLRGNQLQLISGETGRVLKTLPLDNDGYSQLVAIKSGKGNQMHILVRPIGDGLDGHPHGCPNLLYDCNLEQIWGRHDYTRAGHEPQGYDVDGDGRDELLIGLDCANPDGSVRWTIAAADIPVTRKSYFLGHDDRRTVIDIDGDGQPEQVLALENFGVLVSDLKGNILWRKAVPNHCGEARVGKFLADVPGLQILINNERFGLPHDPALAGSELLDCRGNVIRTFADDIYAKTIPWKTAVGPEALLTAYHGAVVSDARPFILDGTGRVIAVFDIPKTLPQITEYKMPQENLWYGDWGDYYNRTVMEIPGIGPSILIWSRRDLWVFAP